MLNFSSVVQREGLNKHIGVGECCSFRQLQPLYRVRRNAQAGDVNSLLGAVPACATAMGIIRRLVRLVVWSTPAPDKLRCKKVDGHDGTRHNILTAEGMQIRATSEAGRTEHQMRCN